MMICEMKGKNSKIEFDFNSNDLDLTRNILYDSDYIEKAREMKCPICNSKNLAFFYDTCNTLIYCRNHNNCFNSRHQIVLITYHHSSEKFGQIFMKAIKNPLNRELLICPNCETYNVEFDVELLQDILKSYLKCHCLMCNHKWEERPKEGK